MKKHFVVFWRILFEFRTNSVFLRPGRHLDTQCLIQLHLYFQLTKKRCARHYNMNCLKVDLISSIDKLSKSTDFNVLPGIKVISNPEAFASQKNADLKMVFSADNVSDQLDELLLKRLTNYARSLSLNVQILDKDQKKGKSFGSSMLENFIRSYYTVDGRGNIFIVKLNKSLYE